MLTPNTPLVEISRIDRLHQGLQLDITVSTRRLYHASICDKGCIISTSTADEFFPLSSSPCGHTNEIVLLLFLHQIPRLIWRGWPRFMLN